ncbi:DUF6474 family protein [Corynebacterium bovis]|uniref:DUF6474 family protein n=1 Tax=Corynebacterium bovis TaxID=36808 RepID=UPI003138EA26
MGLLSSARRRRQEKKAIYKAAKVRAKAEAKSTGKLEKKKEKYLRKTAKQVRKLDQKELKARRKHEETMAKTALEQIKAGRFNSANVLRYTAALRTLAPVAVPLAYRALNQLRSLSEGREASRHGVDRSSMGWVAGTGAPQRARIEDLRFNSANVLRYTAALRTLAPVAVPLAYRALNQLRSHPRPGTAARRTPSRTPATSGSPPAPSSSTPGTGDRGGRRRPSSP